MTKFPDKDDMEGTRDINAGSAGVEEQALIARRPIFKKSVAAMTPTLGSGTQEA